MDGATPRLRFPWEAAPEPGAATEIAGGVLWLRLPLDGPLGHVNAYVLDDGDGWTIVDPGLDTATIRAAWDSALAGPLAGRKVRRVLVTHHHPDHVGLAGWFQAQGARLLMTRTAWLTARMLTLDVQERPSRETLAFWRAAGMDAETFARRANERPYNFADMVAPMPLGFARIAEGDRLDSGGRDWAVRTGGGHAPEHATLWSDDGELVLGGDQLLPTISPNLGVYATEPEADPVADWLTSCRRLAMHADERQLVLPGHGLPYLGLPLRLEQLVENHLAALVRLRAHLSTPRTAAECFPALFKRRIGPGAYGLALVEAMAHCLHLWHLGEATRHRREDGAWEWQLRP